MAKTNDGLLAYQIGQRIEKLEEMGVELPSFDEDVTLEEKAEALKKLVEENKQKAPAKPAQTKLSKLQQEADKLGAYYEPDWTEEQVSVSIQEAKEVAAAEAKAAKATKEATKDAPIMQPDAMESFAKILGEQISRGISASKEGNTRLVSERDFDPADQVEGKTYFVPMIWWKLPAKKIGGQRVMAPYGSITFKLLDGRAVKTGDQWNTQYLSAYYTESKKEQQYMETHPLFNKVFFESDASARITSDQVKFAQKFSAHMANLMTHQAPALYNMAPGLGVKLDHTMSLVAIRNLIAEALAAKDISSEKEHMQQLIQQGQRERLLASTA